MSTASSVKISPARNIGEIIISILGLIVFAVNVVNGVSTSISCCGKCLVASYNKIRVRALAANLTP